MRDFCFLGTLLNGSSSSLSNLSMISCRKSSKSIWVRFMLMSYVWCYKVCQIFLPKDQYLLSWGKELLGLLGEFSCNLSPRSTTEFFNFGSYFLYIYPKMIRLINCQMFRIAIFLIWSHFSISFSACWWVQNYS